METETIEGEFAPAFERLLAECHPLSLARSPVDASGRMSPASRDLWRQLSEGGWLELGSAAMRAEVMAELPLLGAISGRFLLAVPFAFSAFVIAPLAEAAPAAMGKLLPAGTDARPVSGRLDVAQEDADPLPVDYFGDDADYCQAVFGGDAVLVRRLHAQPFVSQGLDAGIAVSMIPKAGASVAAEQKLEIGPRDAMRIIHPFLVFQYAHLIGAAAASLDLAIAYAKERVQFRRPIGEFQAVKHLLANAWVALDNGRYAVNAFSKASPADAGFHELLRLTDRMTAAGAKLATQVAIQVHGAIGFAWEHNAHLYLKRVYRGAAQLTAFADRAGRLEG